MTAYAMKWPWNSNRACSLSLSVLPSCPDGLVISKLQAFHCCNKNGQPNRALSRVQSHPCRFWRIVVASQLLEWSKLGDLFLKKWWLIYFCKCYYFFNYLVNIFFYQKLGKLISNKPHGAALQNLQLSHSGAEAGQDDTWRSAELGRVAFHSQRA